MIDVEPAQLGTRRPEPYSISSTASSRRRRHTGSSSGVRTVEQLVELAPVEHAGQAAVAPVACSPTVGSARMAPCARASAK